MVSFGTGTNKVWLLQQINSYLRSVDTKTDGRLAGLLTGKLTARYFGTLNFSRARRSVQLSILDDGKMAEILYYHAG
jgi:hypothetical protein